MNFDSDFGRRVGPLLAWARYVSWAQLMHEVHHQRLSTHAKDGALNKTATQNDNWALWALLSYSYASLQVAVEGYECLQMQDPTVDKLLASEMGAKLKRYRNAVFHFQRQFIDDRFEALIVDEEHVTWANILRGALVTLAQTQLSAVTGTADEMTEFKKAVTQVFAWAGWSIS